jgi:glycine/D-amino acid oxidase-like deaminating enzyme/nitrite reductase/ring-hydroxylating ferredoxin subunit
MTHWSLASHQSHTWRGRAQRGGQAPFWLCWCSGTQGGGPRGTRLAFSAAMPEEARSTSLWESTVEAVNRPALAGDIEADVAVLGAGITGLTAAVHLKRAGKRVVVLEAKHVGGGTTGHTTGHLSTLWDGHYSELRAEYGDDTVKAVHAAMQGGIDHIEQLVNELAIECGFTRVAGYLYAEEGQSEQAVQRELEAGQACGLPVAPCREVPLPLPVTRALRIEGQGMFHALQYLQGLARAVDGDGSQVLEHSRAIEVTDGPPCQVTTGAGTVRAEHLVMATHTPVGLTALHTELTPQRSYAMAIRTDTPVGEGLFWDTAEPYNYLRRHAIGGQDYLIVGGHDRKTGHGPELESFANLERYVRDRFEVREVCHSWSAQLYEPADRLPFIGRAPRSDRVFVATGMSGDGLPFGTYAGRAIARFILGQDEPHAALYRPARFRPQGLPRWARANLQVAKRFVADRLRADADSREDALAALGRGEGAVLGAALSKEAVYRDDDGHLHRFSAACPHLRCIVCWNAAHKTFDCPCHGSRFAPDGSVLEGPALSGLSRRA